MSYEYEILEFAQKNCLYFAISVLVGIGLALEGESREARELICNLNFTLGTLDCEYVVSR